MPRHPALELLHELTHKYPAIWDLYAKFFHARKMHPEGNSQIRQLLEQCAAEAQTDYPLFDWPEWCWCPVFITVSVLGTVDANFKDRMGTRFGDVAALAAWRCTQSIYRLDPTLFWELASTSLSSNVPLEVLTRLPEWCVYIEIPYEDAPPNANSDFQGVFVFLNKDQHSSDPELWMVFVSKPGSANPGTLPVQLPLIGSIEDGIRRCVDGRLKKKT